MKKKILQYLFLGCSVAVLFSACRKDPYKGKETNLAGTTFLAFSNAPTYQQFFTAFGNVKAITLLILRRDVANKADLAKEATVTVTALPDYIAKYNAANGTSFVTLPTSVYTMDTSNGITPTSDGLSFKFAAGDFAKALTFNVDGSKLDLSKQYAVAYAITGTDGIKKMAGQDTIISTLGIKNLYDGDYSYDLVSAAFGNDAGDAITLTTTGQYTCVYNLINYYSNQVFLTVNPTTNAVTMDVPTLEPTKTDPSSSYDPSTKTFHLKYTCGSRGQYDIQETMVHK